MEEAKLLSTFRWRKPRERQAWFGRTLHACLWTIGQGNVPLAMYVGIRPRGKGRQIKKHMK